MLSDLLFSCGSNQADIFTYPFDFILSMQKGLEQVSSLSIVHIYNHCSRLSLYIHVLDLPDSISSESD